MKNKISKLVVVGAIGMTAALMIKGIKNNESIDLKKSKEQILTKKDNIKNFKEIKNTCNEKINKICSDKFYDKFDKFDKLKNSLFNKQSSTSLVFGNPTYNVYSNEGGSEDGQKQKE